MDRTERIRIFQENLCLFSQGFYTTPSGEAISLEPEEPSFRNRFDKIVFAILEDRNSLHNSATGNFLPFKNEFQNQ